MATQLPLNQVFIMSIWLEAVLYGFLLILFLATCHVNIALRRHQDGHGKIMFGIGILMFAIASAHLGINCFRMLQGYVVHAGDPGGPAAYFGVLGSPTHIAKDTLYATQEILGDAVAIYHTYVIWGRNWKVATPLVALFIACTISGYFVCGLYPSEPLNSSIFDSPLRAWISAFYAMSFVQSSLTTGLMAYRLWSMDRRTARYRADTGGLMPALHILVQSAALQLLAELIVLVLYASGLSLQYIVLETITPLVAVTFNAITIRIALRSSEALSSLGRSPEISDQPPQHTFGSIPMRSIAVDIKDVDVEGDGCSDVDITVDQK